VGPPRFAPAEPELKSPDSISHRLVGVQGTVRKYQAVLEGITVVVNIRAGARGDDPVADL
jgi:hypothetical protein